MNNTDFDSSVRAKKAYKVSRDSIIINTILSAVKAVTGIFAQSSALVSDAAHSFSDVFSTVIVMLGIKFANKAEDKNHPYGHEKFEAIAGTLLAVMLFATAVGIGINGFSQIREALEGGLPAPGYLAAVIAVLSVVTKEFMYQITKKTAKEINSPALMADAWHHRSDAFSSIGSLVGILGAILGFPVLDPAASVVIAFFVAKVALDIFKESVNQTVDTACSDEQLSLITGLILNTEGVIKIDTLKTRVHANRIYIDTEIAVSDKITFVDAHNIAESVHDKIEQEMPAVKHCTVHVNPYDEIGDNAETIK